MHRCPKDSEYEPEESTLHHRTGSLSCTPNYFALISLLSQAAMHKMFIAVARYNKENPGTYCNAASCTNPSACNVVLPPCRVLLSCDGHFNCTVNGSALNPPWLVYENCSRATMQAEADAIAADASMIEALPTGAENTLEAVPTLFGDARGTHGNVDTHGVQYWQQETSKLPCALPAYDSSYMLTNAASQASSYTDLTSI